MASRSLNKVQLIGNLTRDPELRYTPSGAAVCAFGLATNRSWLPEGATERREETEFHRIVAWNKLAELCSQLLTKGRKIYVEGRLQTRSWTAPDGTQRSAVEIVIDDMILLDSRKIATEEQQVPAEPVAVVGPEVVAEETADQVAATSDDSTSKKKKKATKEEEKEEKPEERKESLNPDDIPF